MCREGFVAADYESVMTAYVMLDENGVRGKDPLIRSRAASTLGTCACVCVCVVLCCVVCVWGVGCVEGARCDAVRERLHAHL